MAENGIILEAFYWDCYIKFLDKSVKKVQGTVESPPNGERISNEIMNLEELFDMDLLSKAIEIAAKAHSGQVDKAGAPYILHPLRAMLSVSTETERICAVLHDVIEDTDITIEKLAKSGFHEEILTALTLLTKNKDESYDEFISRILSNPIACCVKLADLRDNMDLSRISVPSEIDVARIQKYENARLRIVEKLSENGQKD